MKTQIRFKHILASCFLGIAHFLFAGSSPFYPTGIAIITHSGTHEISVIDHKAMLDKFLACPDKSALEYDLTFLYGLRKRITLQWKWTKEFCPF